MPNRSSEVAAIVNIPENLESLDGTDEGKRELARLVARELNATIPADGNNWGLLIKNDRTPPFIVTDIIVWLPTGQHADILTDTGPTWVEHPPIPPEWAWLAVAAEGTQEQQTVVRISGSDPESNESGSTYAYVFVSDPGQRFLSNVNFGNLNTSLPVNHPLHYADYTPDAGFFILEEQGTDVTNKMTFKGPGNAVDDVSLFDATQIAAALTFGAGFLTVRSGMSIGQVYHGTAGALWRMDDGSDDPGKFNVVRVVSWVGNGINPRTINLFGGALPAATGYRPKWALVMANTGGAAGVNTKDPSNTNAQSTQIDNGTQVANGITGGAPDAIIVGAALNANGVTHQAFVLMTNIAGGADGWGGHGEDVPVEPDTPVGEGPSGDVPEEPEPDPGGDAGDGDTPGDPGGGDDDIDTDLAPECLPFTKRVFNRALSRIGISTPVTDGVATELTEAAQLCRLHLAAAIQETLRDFPWPFATRYATLQLLGGTVGVPVNRDWQYSYRRPSDCIFERRIAVVRSGAVDPTPPPFQLSFDNTDGRIFTNQPAAILEYTARPDCSAGRGDPLFVDALTWKLASQLAGPLTRVADVTVMCEAQYKAALDKALEVIRPGNPGPRTSLDPTSIDQGQGCIAANLAVANRGLIRIGCRTMANMDTEQSREAEAVRVIFEAELRATLRAHPWAFATKYDDALRLIRGPFPGVGLVQDWSSTSAYPIGDSVILAGVVYYAIAPNFNQQPPNAAFWSTSATQGANEDWTYAYRVPPDSVMVRRIARAAGLEGSEGWNWSAGNLSGGQRAYDRQPPQYRLGQDVVGPLLFTNTPDPTIEYTSRLACACGRADELFKDALAWRLAASLAPSLMQVDAEGVEQHGRGPQDRPRERKANEARFRAAAADAAWRMYAGIILQARAADMKEQQQDPNQGDADWILGRE
jgi:hypothetical protein